LFSPNVDTVIKSRRMRWARHVACWGKQEMQMELVLENFEKRNYFKDPATDGRFILE
jgi:hypothetical protein